MTTFLYKYRVPICLSLALHLGVLILVFIKMPSKGLSLAQLPAAQPAPVQATAVDSAQLAKQVQAIQQEQFTRDNVREQHLKEIQEKAEAAKEAQANALAQVEKLKAKQAQMKEAEVLREKKLAEMARKEKAEKAKMIAQQKAEEKKIKAAQALQKKRLLAKKSQELQQKLMAQQLAQENTQLNKIQSSENAQAQSQETASLVNKYTSKILGVIGDNWNIAPGTSSDLKVQYLIHVAPDGSVLSATLVKTSGDPLLDDSAKVAIMKSSPLPVPKDSADFEHFREFRLTLSPQHVKELSDATA